MNTIDDIRGDLAAYDQIFFDLENHILTWSAGDNVLPWQDEIANKLVAKLKTVKKLQYPAEILPALIDLQGTVIAAMAGDEKSATQQFARLTHKAHYEQQERSKNWYLKNGHEFRSKAAAARHMAEKGIIPLTCRVIEGHLSGLPIPRHLKPRE